MSQARRGKKAVTIKKQTEDLAEQPLLEEEFDIVEEEPDQISSSSESGEENGQEEVDSSLVPNSEETPEERVRRIESVQLSFRDFLSCLDYNMLGLFALSMIAFFTFGLLLSLVLLSGVFFFNEDLWYEYFPVSDEENNYSEF